MGKKVFLTPYHCNKSRHHYKTSSKKPRQLTVFSFKNKTSAAHWSIHNLLNLFTVITSSPLFTAQFCFSKTPFLWTPGPNSHDRFTVNHSALCHRSCCFSFPDSCCRSEWNWRTKGTGTVCSSSLLQSFIFFTLSFYLHHLRKFLMFARSGSMSSLPSAWRAWAS